MSGQVPDTAFGINTARFFLAQWAKAKKLHVKSSWFCFLGSFCQAESRIMSAAFSAIITTGDAVLPETMRGMIEASTTRSPSMPRTRSSGSTTALSSTPIRQVPTG